MLTVSGKEQRMSRNQGAQPYEVSLRLLRLLSLRVHRNCQDRIDLL
jgi:hypothetical protein